MRIRARSRSLKLVLTAWLLVVTTSPAFSHDHADGDKPHGHDLGLISAPAANVPDPGAGQGMTPDTRHSHLVILGIEIHLPASCPWSADKDSPLSGEQGMFSLGAELANAANVLTQASADLQPLLSGLPALADEALLAPAQNYGMPSDPFSFPSISLLCDRALGLRSGTQQI